MFFIIRNGVRNECGKDRNITITLLVMFLNEKRVLANGMNGGKLKVENRKKRHTQSRTLSPTDPCEVCGSRKNLLYNLH